MLFRQLFYLSFSLGRRTYPYLGFLLRLVTAATIDTGNYLTGQLQSILGTDGEGGRKGKALGGSYFAFVERTRRAYNSKPEPHPVHERAADFPVLDVCSAETSFPVSLFT